jgi:hypothetical protein
VSHGAPSEVDPATFLGDDPALALVGHTVNEHGHVVRGQDGRQIAYTRCRECDCRRVKVAKVGRRLDGCT